ncbi:uncharacterized protein LOC116187500 isoform X1 [Punica granatum]|uniref:Uncharacterized protein LOC116187500 isoform X1 n=1 Tax=Punica granatum TaxID=22663 RepID=A0A6P8BN83_PUNGR|nr:uncharacterized protein LOC116187500 isoform X1 [Punica granatum]
MKLFLSLTGNSDETYMGYERWLPSPPKVDKPRSVYNAASLAYIGDCIYELYARRHFLFPPLNIDNSLPSSQRSTYGNKGRDHGNFDSSENMDEFSRDGCGHDEGHGSWVID